MAEAAVEIVAVGNELLLGETVDTNAAWLGRRLAAVGVRVARRATVGDTAADIRDAVTEALERTGAVICTGGLGPTPDDLTKPVVAAIFRRELVLDAALLEALRRRFEARGIRMAPNNRTQAEVPAGATIFPNPRGTAPGLLLEDERGRFAILLPGVPAEMRAIVDGSVIDYLVRRWPARPGPILHRTLRTTGIPESTLAERVADLLPPLEPLTVAFLPSAVGVDIRLTSWGGLPAAEARRRLEAADLALTARLGGHLYGRDAQDLVDVVSERLVAAGLSLSLAESCTGGLIAKRLTDRPGASGFLTAGIVSYSNEAKVALLGVRPETLRDHGAVSVETAREMADGVRARTGARAAIAVTGIAGPDGGSEAKPVGTVWIAVAVDGAMDVRHFRFPGDRAEVRERAAQAALALLLEHLPRAEGS
ncbi:MAG: competence/damage-inducible protein A [Gemmatimonadetes bacterium]|nr:competence/damage-inducible protein A [Gemmatimonadota bacterium]